MKNLYKLNLPKILRQGQFQVSERRSFKKIKIEDRISEIEEELKEVEEEEEEEEVEAEAEKDIELFKIRSKHLNFSKNFI